jgi:hypothetical protein
MLSHFPTRETDDAVTRDHLDARLADVRAEIADLRTHVTETAHAQTRWTVATILGAAVVVVGAVALLG